MSPLRRRGETTHPAPSERGAAPRILAAASPGFESLLGALGTQGYRVHYQPSPAQARKALARQSFDLLLVEADGSRPEGLALARLALRRTPPVPVILLSRPDRPLPAAAFALEAADYLQWPEPLPAAVRRVARALGQPYRRTRAEAERRAAAWNLKAFALVRELAQLSGGRFQALARILRQIQSQAGKTAGRCPCGAAPPGVVEVMEVPA